METIGAHGTAATLRTIQSIMGEHGVTHERGDHAHMQEWQITTFAECHGEELSQMADLIGQEVEELYIYDCIHDREGEPVFDVLSAYIERRRDDLVAGSGSGRELKTHIMLSAEIWFHGRQHPLSLLRLKPLLANEPGCAVEDTEWRLNEFVVPQLRITAPARFLRIEDEPHVAEEAKELAEEFGRTLPPAALPGPHVMAASPLGSRATFPSPSMRTGASVGPPTFDRGCLAVNPLLKSIASRIDGFLWDNVNATVWWGPR